MKEVILQYVREYAPVVLCFVMMFIDKFGFGTLFSSFKTDVTNALNVSKLNDSIAKMSGTMQAALDENTELREELKKIKEALQRVKGGK